MKLFYYKIIILFLIIPLHSFGQFEYNFIRYTLKDGLPSNKIYDIVQDKEGFIWFGTDKGIAKFDGYQFQHFTTLNGLPNNDIWSLYLDNRGRIFAKSYYEGLICIENDEVKLIPYPSKQIWSNISSYIELNDKLWIRSLSNIFSFSDTLVKENEILNFNQRYLNSQFYKDGSNNDYVVAHFEREDKRARPYINIYKDDELIDSIHITDNNDDIEVPLKSPDIFYDNKLYYWNKEAIFQYDFDRFKYKKKDLNQLTHNQPITKFKYLGLRIWQVNDTLYYFDESFNLSEKLAVNNIDIGGKILIDHEGNWWMNTGNQGVICLTDQGKYNIQIKPSPPDVTSVHVDDAGQILYTNTYLFNPSKRHKVFVQDGQYTYPIDLGYKPISIIKPVFIKDNRVLIANYHKSGFEFVILNKEKLFNKEKLQLNQFLVSKTERKRISIPKSNFALKFKFSDISYKDISYNPKTGNVWLGSHAGISLLEYDKETQKYTYIDVLINGRTYAIVNQDNLIWYGGFDGLFYAYNDNLAKQDYNLEEFKKESFNYSVSDLVVDSFGRMWIATDGFGLYTCKNCLEETPVLIKDTEGDIVQEIFIDESNNVWLATSDGVKKVEVENRQDFKTSITTFSTAHGLPTPIINSVFVKNNITYVATSEGITLLHPLKQKDLVRPKLIIPNVVVNNEKQKVSDLYNLSYRENNILINYLCLSFKSQKRITYKYKMEGISDDWRTTTTLEKEYLQLNPGTYTFQVQAFDINGVKSEIKRITFIIEQPWWQSNLFFLGLIGSVGLIIYGIFSWRIRRLAKQQQTELAINKKFAELELQTLQSQMNPHFIFNSLSAIQNFILSNDIRSANKYLVKFSKLMRAFLDASTEKYITLQDELALLKLYVELEQLRFKGQFEVDWQIDSEVDVFTGIPSMLFQPFVENAINHGLAYKETKGLLKIHVIQKDTQLHCVIEDNGVGRKKAKLIQEQALKTHKSRGMSIIEERLKTLELIQGLSVKINIVDLKNVQQNDCGTQVNILFHI
jgi:ligand-binding sensor domain-containing protein